MYVYIYVHTRYQLANFDIFKFLYLFIKLVENKDIYILHTFNYSTKLCNTLTYLESKMPCIHMSKFAQNSFWNFSKLFYLRFMLFMLSILLVIYSNMNNIAIQIYYLNVLLKYLLCTHRSFHTCIQCSHILNVALEGIEPFNTVQCTCFSIIF